ncbi:MAG: hypothetical protein AB2662_17450 [Candidatus Thiodiazotropha sp.]
MKKIIQVSIAAALIAASVLASARYGEIGQYFSEGVYLTYLSHDDVQYNKRFSVYVDENLNAIWANDYLDGKGVCKVIVRIPRKGGGISGFKTKSWVELYAELDVSKLPYDNIAESNNSGESMNAMFYCLHSLLETYSTYTDEKIQYQIMSLDNGAFAGTKYPVDRPDMKCTAANCRKFSISIGFSSGDPLVPPYHRDPR